MIIPVKFIKHAYLPFKRFPSLFRNLCSGTNSLYSCNSKITRCFRNGDIKAALTVFTEMPRKNTVTWNCMISGLIKNQMLFDARQVFDQMPSRNVVSWTAMLNGYAKCGRLLEARSLFDAMIDKNVVCWNAMLSGYVRNQQIDEAKKLFEEIPEKNAVSWATIIEGCFHEGLVEEAEKLFTTCPFEDVLINNTMLSAYFEINDLDSLWKFFTMMSKLDVASWTTAIRGFTKAGKMEKARSLFDQMPTKDIIAWTVMIQGYLENNQIEDARKLFDEMPQRDIVAWNSMISGYIKQKSLEQALDLFKKMPKRNIVSWNTILQGYTYEHDMIKAQIFFNNIPIKDQTTWNIMICGYQNDESLNLYAQMIQNGIKPDYVTFSALISVCGSLAIHTFGKSIHLCVIKHGYDTNPMVITSLISMYSKCGFMDDAKSIFHKTTKKDTVSWNAMIMAHAYHGSGLKAMKIFTSMTESGSKPNHLTFLGLLMACAHSGMVKEGWKYFNSMEKEWNVELKPEHYASMVDILGRNGMVDEAYELVKKFPNNVPSNTWETLLSCCKVHEKFEIGEKVAGKVKGDVGMSVLCSNIYAARGRWEDACNVRGMMAQSGVKKEVACSWIELKGRVFRFVCNDKSHIEFEEVYEMLECVLDVMKIYR